MKFLKNLLVLSIVLAILACVVFCSIYQYYNIEKKELTDDVRKQAGGSYIKLSQGITHYQLDGPDTGKVVVMVNGFSVPYYIWDGPYENLVNKGFKVLRYDLYGRGYSDRPNTVYNKALYLQQLKELIAGLNINQPVDLVGVSFGGMLVTDFTCTYPNLVNKIVLIDPSHEFKAPLAPLAITNFREVINTYDRANSKLKDFKYPEQHPTWVKQYLPQMQYKGFRNSLVSTMHNYKFYGNQSNACLNSKNKQVLLIWGEDDTTTPFAQSSQIRAVLKTDFLPVPNAGHLSYLDQPDIVNKALVTFFKK